MYRLLRLVGVVLSVLLIVAGVLLAIFLGLGLLSPTGWMSLPFVGLMIWLTLARLRYRRVTAILEHLRAAYRLNLPLPGTLAAAAASESGRLRERLGDLANSVSRGAPLADALDSDVPEVPARERAVLRAAGVSGRLPQALDRLLAQRRNHQRVADTDAGFVLAYPALMVGSLACVMAFLLVVVVPKFGAIFNGFAVPMPSSTVLVTHIGRWLGGNLPGQEVPGLVWVGLAVLVVLGLAVGAWLARGRTMFRVLRWYLPLLHALERDRGLGDVCHVLAQGLEAGLPIDRALAQAEELRTNPVLAHRVARWGRAAAVGRSLADAARAAEMPALFVGVLASGQAGAELAPMFRFLGRHYDTRFSRTAAVLRGAAVPAMVLTFGSMVGLLAVSMFLPLVVLIRSLTLLPWGQP